MEEAIRIAAFAWLKEQSLYNGGVFNRIELESGFTFKGNVITLVGPKGIWFPKGFSIPISISTTSNGPYDDGFNDDGTLEYRYRGNDPNHPDNKGLQLAFQKRIPLIYFHSIKPGKYVAVWPLYISENNPLDLKIKASIEPSYPNYLGNAKDVVKEPIPIYDADYGVRKYITAMTKQRLHQSAFREYVLDAYSRQCTMYKLQHTELLDAAHIVSDNEDQGEPVVQNGLSLCKIHHAAYDKMIIGITPDFVIKVREDILAEVDGPMLKYGLQSLEGNSIILPKRKGDYPDRDRLAWRFERFVS